MAGLSLEEVMAAVEAVRRDLQAQIDGLQAELATLRAAAPVAALARSAPSSAPEPEPVSEEVLVILAAAVTAYLGKKVRIRSARLMPTPHDSINPWAQHGRVFVQATAHDLRRLR
jgi:methylmalonyl-CoA carboxyltransferase large subunit